MMATLKKTNKDLPTMTKAQRRKLQIEVAYHAGAAAGYDGDEFCIPDEYDDAELSEAWVQGYEDAEEEAQEMDDEEDEDE